MLTLKPVVKNVYTNPSINLFVIGSGGTGGYLLQNLARLVWDMEQNGKEVSLTIVDGDIVEQKNLLRQSFYRKDVGKNKAEVTAVRLNKMFGMNVSAVSEYLESTDSVNELLGTSNTNVLNVVVGCVDNHRTRQLLQEVYAERQDFLWIDSGNDEFSGQIIVGSPFEGDLTKLPSIVEAYPEILEIENALFNSEVSCDDAAVDNIQNIAANINAANYLFNIINRLLSTGEISIHQVKFNVQTNTTLVTTIADVKEQATMTSA